MSLKSPPAAVMRAQLRSNLKRWAPRRCPGRVGRLRCGVSHRPVCGPFDCRTNVRLTWLDSGGSSPSGSGMRSKRYVRLRHRQVVFPDAWQDDVDRLADVVSGANCPDQALRPGSVVGVVRAGEPEADAFVEETPPASLLDEFKVRPTDVFFRVRGSSMVEAGIEEGDLVQIRQIRPGTCPQDGEIVLAEVGIDQAIGERSGRITIKRFYKYNNGIRLQPANSTMSALDYGLSEVAVLGIVVNVIRQFTPT